ncbi:MAG: RNA methyltransferase [Planctomycetota bacterium]|nr:MAG: RNA methyltransferase [Planctomycetota bacterium]
MTTDPIISSTANLRIKALARLRAHRGRSEGNTILVDGLREIRRAAEADLELLEAFYLSEGASPECRDVVEICRRRGAKCIQVSPHVMEKLNYGDRTTGLVLTAVRPTRTFADLKPGDRPLIAVVDAIEKPGNLGAILRSADGAGIDGVIAADPIADVYSPNVIRASIGTIFTVPLVEAAGGEALAWLRARGLALVAASPKGARLHTEIDFRRPTAMVFGSEARGLGRDWKQGDIEHVRVPMMGAADSLNVSATAALFFYEARRQRGALK